MKPSHFQEKIIGSGKSSTLKLAALALQDIKYSPSEIKICVFGKANSQGLLAKIVVLNVGSSQIILRKNNICI